MEYYNSENSDKLRRRYDYRLEEEETLVHLRVRLILGSIRRSLIFFAIFNPHTGPKFKPSLRSIEFLRLGSDSAL